MTPTIVITRPLPQARAFAAALDAAHGGALPMLLAPLMEIVPIEPDLPIGDVAHVIFTSANGVAQADRLQIAPSTIAWCVGDRTAQAAAAGGLETRNAGGDSDALLRMIIDARPRGRIVHLHGAHVAGRVVGDLQDAGLNCEGRVVYDQIALPPSDALRQALCGDAPLILPLFSPRSARLLQEAGPITAPLTLVSISAAVAEAAKPIPHSRLMVAAHPDQNALIEAILAVIG